jgi:hypothetical protein
MHRPPPPRAQTLSDVFEKLDALDRANLELKGDLGSLAAELASVRALASTAVSTHRDPESSYHDFDAHVKQFRETLLMTAKRDSVRARQIAQEAVRTAERDGKAARWDKLVQTAWRVAIGVAIGVLVSGIIYRFGMR